MVVSDTSVLTALITIGQENILSTLYGKVIIPDAVDRELRRGHVNLPGFVHACVAPQNDALRRRLQVLDAGEAEAITLAEALKADLLLIDEKLGRRLAAESNIPIMGLMGVLIEAKRKGLLARIAPILTRLELETGFRLAVSLRQQVLETAGEPGQENGTNP